MPDNDRLPPEILRKVFNHLNFVKHPTNYFSDAVKFFPSGFKKNELTMRTYYGVDTSILNAMRVCRFWRNMVFSILFDEDVSSWEWTRENWTMCQRMFKLREVEDACLYGNISWDVADVRRGGTRKPGWGMWEKGDRW